MQFACANDELRPSLNYIYFNGGYAYATNAHILVKNYLKECSTFSDDDIEKLNGKFLSPLDYADILKYDIVSVEPNGLRCKKNNRSVLFYFADVPELKFPNADALIERNISMKNEPVEKISINIKLLQQLNKSLYNSDKCELEFKSEGVVLFRSKDKFDKGIGLIMVIKND